MGDLSALDITREVLQDIYDNWCEGARTSHLERCYPDKPESHSKLFSSPVREHHLGIETEHKCRLTAERDERAREVGRLKAQLRSHGISPDDAAGPAQSLPCRQSEGPADR